MQERLVFYYKKSCTECADVEAILESMIMNYDRVAITASPNPGMILVWSTDPPTEIPEAQIPAVPALWDRGTDNLWVGRRAIFGYLA